jgi:uncharacterized membrane protein
MKPLASRETLPPKVWQRRLPSRPGLLSLATRGFYRLAYLTIMGLVLGIIVHIITVFSIPLLATHDAVTRFADTGLEGRAERIDPQADPAWLIADHDPATSLASCGFDLTEGPVRVTARTGALPLGLSIHRRGGGVAYAITDRAAIRGVLDFVVLTPAQLADRIAREDDGETMRELRVVLNVQQGLIVARALARQPSDRADADALVRDMACVAAE